MLTLHSVTAGYGDSMVLRAVDFHVGEHEVVALLGPNGAGKTTLLRTATGFVKPRSGRIELDGEDLTGQSPHTFARKGACQLPEGRGIFPSLTIEENLRIQARGVPLGDALDTITEVFPVLGARRHQVAGSLSGGEQQMLALARAYLSEPKVILADEVSLGLAPLVVEEIYSALTQLAASGTSLVIVEQYVQRALALAATVYVLNRGEVVHTGRADALSPDDVYQQYLGIEA